MHVSAVARAQRSASSKSSSDGAGDSEWPSIVRSTTRQISQTQFCPRQTRRPQPHSLRSKRHRAFHALLRPHMPAAVREIVSYPAAQNSRQMPCAISSRRLHSLGTVRIRQRILNRRPHIRRRKLRDHRSIDKFDHRMNHRLRMHDHFDFLGPHVEQPAGFDDLQALY